MRPGARLRRCEAGAQDRAAHRVERRRGSGPLPLMRGCFACVLRVAKSDSAVRGCQGIYLYALRWSTIRPGGSFCSAYESYNERLGDKALAR